MGDGDGQQAKLERAVRDVEVSKRRARDAGVPMEQESVHIADIQTKSLKDQHQNFLFAMSNALQEHSEDVLPLFESLCNEKGIARPSRPPSVASSRPGSSRSSMLGMVRPGGP